MNYNYLRDYNPSTGRHVQNDLIGLMSKELSRSLSGKSDFLSEVGQFPSAGTGTYIYASSKPLNAYDSLGLFDQPGEGGIPPRKHPGGCPLIIDLTLFSNPIRTLPPIAMKVRRYSCAPPGSCPHPDAEFAKYIWRWNPQYPCPEKAFR